MVHSTIQEKRPATATDEVIQEKRPAPPVPPSEGVEQEPTAKASPNQEPTIEESTPQESSPIKVKKTPPVYADVAARLAAPVAAIELTDIQLGKAVELLATMGALPVTLDTDSMTLLGVTPRDPISLQLDSTSIGEALQAVAAQKGLAVTVENGQVLITAPATEGPDDPLDLE